MSAQTYDDDAETPQAKRPARWLPILETVLKSRVGWWDEAISPFARMNRRTSKPVPAMEPAATIPATDDRVAA